MFMCASRVALNPETLDHRAPTSYLGYIPDFDLEPSDLRKEARYLENEIDTKLVSYSKVGAATTFSIISET